MTLLQIQDLAMHFGGLKALDGISLTVNEGEIMGIIGPNGSGKTTLFNVITGVYRASGGNFRFKGTEMVGREPHEIARAGIARTFQHSRLMTGLSVLDNILLGFYGRRQYSLFDAVFRRGKVEQELSGLADKAAELVSVFSPQLVSRFFAPVGDLPFIDRRRVEVCRALAAQPSLLLLDEPTAGMNPDETEELIADVRKVRDSIPGMTVIIIEHDMAVIGGVSDRVVCLNYGKMIAEGSFQAVAAHPDVRSAYLGGEVVA